MRITQHNNNLYKSSYLVERLRWKRQTTSVIFFNVLGKSTLSNLKIKYNWSHHAESKLQIWKLIEPKVGLATRFLVIVAYLSTCSRKSLRIIIYPKSLKNSSVKCSKRKTVFEIAYHLACSFRTKFKNNFQSSFLFVTS